MSVFSSNKTRLRDVHPPLIYNLKSRVPSAPWKLHLWLNNDYNLPSDKIYLCVCIYIYVYNFKIKALHFFWMSSAGTGSWCQQPRMQPGRNSPPASEGLSNCPGFFPFWTGSLTCNFSCYLPRGKWSIWYNQGIPHLLHVTSAWEGGVDLARSQQSPWAGGICCFHFCTSEEKNSQALVEPPPLSCSTALKLGEILTIEQIWTWFNKARRASESSCCCWAIQHLLPDALPVAPFAKSGSSFAFGTLHLGRGMPMNPPLPQLEKLWCSQGAGQGQGHGKVERRLQDEMQISVEWQWVCGNQKKGLDWNMKIPTPLLFLTSPCLVSSPFFHCGLCLVPHVTPGK